jgi:hypothetical protein
MVMAGIIIPATGMAAGTGIGNRRLGKKSGVIAALPS